MRSIPSSLWLTAVAAITVAALNGSCDAVHDVLSATSSLLDDFRIVQDSTEQWLQHHLDDVVKRQTALEELNELLEQQEASAALEAQLVSRTAKLQDLVAQVNARQLHYLAKQLNDTVRLELQSRSRTGSTSSNSIIGDSDNNHTATEVVESVSFEDMQQLIAGNALLNDTEAALQNWMVQFIKDEVLDKRIKIDIAQAAALKKKKKKVKTKKKSTPSETCLTPTDGAQLIHDAMVVAAQEKSHVDLLTGATVVHELTSDTYLPPPRPDDRMGNVWWRPYIPQDWERYLLPVGWEDWNVALPSSLYRALNIRGASTVPPEAIMDANLHPGACWPLAGTKGYVTLRLAQPLAQFESITIDHAPLLWNNNGNAGSTPRGFEIVGYPECSKGCHGLGFDVTKGKVLTSFDFDTTSTKSSQTFEAPREGSCSEVKLSCDTDDADQLAPTKTQGTDSYLISAIRIEILGNYGNEDYTCLYRARLQGVSA